VVDFRMWLVESLFSREELLQPKIRYIASDIVVLITLRRRCLRLSVWVVFVIAYSLFKYLKNVRKYPDETQILTDRAARHQDLFSALACIQLGRKYTTAFQKLYPIVWRVSVSFCPYRRRYIAITDKKILPLQWYGDTRTLQETT
jgi:hypothetical protein